MKSSDLNQWLSFNFNLNRIPAEVPRNFFGTGIQKMDAQHKGSLAKNLNDYVDELSFV